MNTYNQKLAFNNNAMLASNVVENPYRIAADTITEDEIDAAKAVLDSGHLTMGEHVRSFERSFAEWTGSEYAVMVNSGSSANLLAVDVMIRSSYGDSFWKPGDEILVPALSWPTTVWPIIQLGLTPVFVDVDKFTLAIDLESAQSALSTRTKGMFLIHVLGQSPNMEEYLSFCRANNLQLIEDVCESLGAHHNGIHAGNFGVLGTFSCYYSHHISTIEGGIITTNERNIYDELKSLRAHGWVRDRSDQSYWKEQYPQIDERFMFITSGYNVRPMELQGAIGSVQLKKLDGFLEGRENLAREVSEWLSSYVPWLHLIGSDRLPDKNAKEKGRRDRSHSWMMLPLRIDADAPVDVKQLKMHLESRGVETRALIAGNLARHPATKRFSIRSADSLAQCDELLAYGLMLGCHPVLDDKTKQTLKDAICSLGEL